MGSRLWAEYVTMLRAEKSEANPQSSEVVRPAVSCNAVT